MKFLPRSLFLAAPIMAVSMLMAPCAANAQAVGHLDHNVRLTQGGRTDIGFTNAFVALFTSLNLSITATDSAEIRGGRVFLPVSAGGVVDVNLAAMQVLHTGAITFSGTGTNTITLSGLILDATTYSPTITGLVTMNGTFMGRVTLFDILPPPGMTLPLTTTDELLQISGITVNVDPALASTLNTVYSTNIFQAGYNAGTANLNAFLL
jgi:hypothetical protein